jgi:alkylation response protein AidB-like acyl-CoA dehydrogenase
MSEAERKDSPEQAEFRQHCRTWLQANHPGRARRSPAHLPPGDHDPGADGLPAGLAEGRLRRGAGGLRLPEAVGGGGRKDCQRIANEEMLAARTPFFPNVIGLGMAAPTVLNHGSEELKARLLPRLLSGEDIWCQGFSEPGAGSDLANVQTFAERKGTRLGHQRPQGLDQPRAFAEWMILLLRTDKSHKYDGLSYFVVPIAAALWGRASRCGP